jgi:hypothetical protein
MAEVESPSLQYSASTPPVTGQAERLGHAAKERVSAEVNARKGSLATQLGSVASAIEETARTLEGRIPGAERFAQAAVRSIRGISDSLENKSTEELVAQAKSQLRERPVPILLGCLAVGFFGARMLRR